MIRLDTRVFISAATRELGSVRKLVKKALEDNDCFGVEQDNFPTDYRDLKDKLRRRIASCDAVVHIAGLCYGAEPQQRPADTPRRSYTQLEYDIAAELKKPVYVFLTGDDFPADSHETEPPELRELQEAHRQSLTSNGRDYSRVDRLEQLDQKVRSLPLKVERFHKLVDVIGGWLGRSWAAVAFLVILTLGTVGIVAWQQQVARRAAETQRHKQEREWREQERERERQASEREKQKQERLAAEAARKEAETVKKVQQEFAERLLHQLLTDKKVSAEEAQQRALKELPALVNLPLADIRSLLDRTIPRPSPADRARADLPKGDLDAVFRTADAHKQESPELAMLDGTAALARFRLSPEPKWNERALAAFHRAMALADPNSSTEWQAWSNAADAAASVYHDLARYAEAEPLLRECLRLREAHGEPDSPGVATALNNLAELLHDTNRLAEAEPLFRRALTIYEHSYGPDHPGVATALDNLARLLYETNRLAAAEPLFRRALEIHEHSYGSDHPDVATDLNNLAELLRATNRLAEAEPLFRRALASFEHSYGPDHPQVWFPLDNLARLLYETNRRAEAEPLFRLALAIGEHSYSPDHPQVARDLNNLAALLQATNRLAEAEPLYRRALAIDEHSYGPDHPDVAATLNNLAQLLRATNRLREAEPLMRRSVCIFARFQRSTGHEHPHYRDATEGYRKLLSLLKVAESEIAARIKAAKEGTEKLSPIVPEVERMLGPARPVADVLAALDRQYRKQGKPAVYFLKPREPIAPHVDQLLRTNADQLNAKGEAAFSRRALADAVVLYQAALDLMDDQPAQVAARLSIRMSRAGALFRLSLVRQARDELSKLLSELAQVPDADPLMKGQALYALAVCQWRLGDRTSAQRSAEESLAAYDGAPKAKPVDPALRRKSQDLVADVKNGKVPPPLDSTAGSAALEAARARHRAREALAKLSLKETAAPLLDQVLGPARSTQEVLEALDRRYREQGKPAVWFLPLKEPIAPHLDQLLGPARSVTDVLEGLDRQYRAQGKPAVWFLPLEQPIAPHLDKLLGKPSK
jgi:tetratricopeptide (TPR) repeat protein